MKTTLDGDFMPDAEGGPARCLFCDLVIDMSEGRQSPGWPVFDGVTVCHDCSEKLETEAPANAASIDRVLSILTSVEREVLTLHYGLLDRQCYNFDEIGERLGLTPQLVAEIEGLALEKTSSFARKHSPDDRL
jgi:hypothetical protein